MLETPQRLQATTLPRRKVHHQSAELNNTWSLKEQLVREMLELNKQCEDMEVGASQVDFSMRQTYKEMIHSRQQMLTHLNDEF